MTGNENLIVIELSVEQRRRIIDVQKRLMRLDICLDNTLRLWAQFVIVSSKNVRRHDGLPLRGWNIPSPRGKGLHRNTVQFS